MTVYYPPWGFYYKVEFELEQRARTTPASSRCPGLSVEYDTEEYKEGGENRFTHKLPVRTKYSRPGAEARDAHRLRASSSGSSTRSASGSSSRGP